MDEKIKILVVDDDPDTLFFTTRVMRNGGYEVISASTGNECLTLARDIRPDIILLDINLPDIIGFEVCRRIKTDPDLANIFVIHLSAEHISSDSQVYGLEGGADGYIILPVSGKELLARIEAMIRIKKTEQALRESEEKFRVITETAQDAIIMMDSKGNISYWNSAAELMFGYAVQEVIGKELHRLIAPERHYESYEQGSNNFKKHGVGPAVGKTTELSAIDKHGREFPVELSLSSVKVKGEWAAVGIVRDISERKKAEEELHTLSITDPLTGLYNRRGFLMLAQQQLKLAERTMKGLTILFADLDGMKWINDNLGHLEGDEALIETAQALRDVFRESDIIGRVGGDEFAMLAIDAPEFNSDAVILRLQEHINAGNTKEGRRYRISISIGVSYFDPLLPSTLDELMAKADILMYEQKKGKKVFS